MKKVKQPSFSRRLWSIRNRHINTSEKSFMANSDRLSEIKNKILLLEQEIAMMKIKIYLNEM